MKREQKQQLITEYAEVFKKAGLVVVALNKGLSMPETTALRNAVRADGAGFERFIKRSDSDCIFRG